MFWEQVYCSDIVWFTFSREHSADNHKRRIEDIRQEIIINREVAGARVGTLAI